MGNFEKSVPWINRMVMCSCVNKMSNNKQNQQTLVYTRLDLTIKCFHNSPQLWFAVRTKGDNSSYFHIGDTTTTTCAAFTGRKIQLVFEEWPIFRSLWNSGIIRISFIAVCKAKRQIYTFVNVLQMRRYRYYVLSFDKWTLCNCKPWTELKWRYMYMFSRTSRCLT